MSSVFHNPDAMFPITSLFACVVRILTSRFRVSSACVSIRLVCNSNTISLEFAEICIGNTRFHSVNAAVKMLSLSPPRVSQQTISDLNVNIFVLLLTGIIADRSTGGGGGAGVKLHGQRPWAVVLGCRHGNGTF